MEVINKKIVSKNIKIKYLKLTSKMKEKFVFTPIAEIARRIQKLEKLLIKLIK